MAGDVRDGDFLGGHVSEEGANAQHAGRINAVTIIFVQDFVLVGGSVVKQAGRRRRPSVDDRSTKRGARPDTDSSQRLSLLHIVVSRQQDFAPPQPPPSLHGFIDHPGLAVEPPPLLEMDAIHSLSPRRPFAGGPSAPPFLPVRPISPDAQFQQQQQQQQEDRYMVSVFN